MDDIDRRKLLVGSGLALTLAACSEGEPSGKRRKVSGEDKYPGMKNFSSGHNRGDNPWESTDEQQKNFVKFEPKYVALIYVNVRAYKKIGMDILRVHFPIDPKYTGWSGANGIEVQVAKWINYLNKNSVPPPPAPGAPEVAPGMPQPKAGPPPWPTPIPTRSPQPGAPTPLIPQYFLDNPPTQHSCYAGIGDLAFSCQQHVVIYVRNDGIEYDPECPIWFGDTLRDTILEIPIPNQDAHSNDSFYMSKPPRVSQYISKGWANKLVHFRNYYQIGDGPGSYKSITNERVMYSLNVNAWIDTGPDSPDMLVILDPDTGNMGEGQP